MVTIPANSVSTVRFVKSRDRQTSNMEGSTTLFDRLDDMAVTNSSFGTDYQLSGKTVSFDISNPLISKFTDLNSGYVQLDNRYSQLVMQIKEVTTTGSLTAGATTLTYVNANGDVAKHDYGRMDLSRAENFNLVFDLSPQTLADGCQGLLSLTCDNSYSHLTVTFGDVYLSAGTTPLYAATLKGDYVPDNGYWQEYIADAACTSIDMTACSSCPSQFPWLQGTNRVVWLPETSSVGGANLIHTDTCHELVLSSDGGAFRPQRSFYANEISFTLSQEGQGEVSFHLIMLPFNAIIPDGVKAYIIGDDLRLEQMRSIPAHTPVLVEANGEAIFTGQGEVGYENSPLSAVFRGTYTPIPLYADDYVLDQQDGQWGLRRLDAPTMLNPFGVYATLTSQEPFVPLQTSSSGIKAVTAESTASATYDLQGRRVLRSSKNGQLKPGVYIRNGKKVVMK